ncbi:hypothetical protein H4R34_001357 [Dimargaris verticillata]|uniref:Uncharacterized protein n=1 Tax=Dimargaris verticillata TaxID=2761393 RepID=A0A9W8B6C8_9FUNG|nr:hypothetical protein H4R34_001357 [Dimargaris verticillata]
MPSPHLARRSTAPAIKRTQLYATSTARHRRELLRHPRPITFIEDLSPAELQQRYQTDPQQLFVAKLEGLRLGLDASSSDALAAWKQASGDWDLARLVLAQGPRGVLPHTPWTTAEDRMLLSGADEAQLHVLWAAKGEAHVYQRLRYLHAYYSPEMGQSPTLWPEAMDATEQRSVCTNDSDLLTSIVGLDETLTALTTDPFILTALDFLSDHCSDAELLNPLEEEVEPTGNHHPLL